MKTKITIFAISIMVLLFAGCKKTNDLSDVTFSINNESVTVGTNMVKLTADYSYSGMVKSIVMEISEKENLNDMKTYNADISGNSFAIKASGLKPLTIYYYRIKSDLGYDIFIGEVKKIQTNDYSVPIVSTANTSDVTAVSVRCSGELLDGGGLETTEKGFCCSKFSNPTIDGIHVISENNTDVFTATITGLEINVKYYIRAYAKNSKGVGYGNEISFTTLDGKPIVTTNTVTDISFTTATCGGNVTSNGGFAVTERGVCWSTSENPTTSGSHSSSGSGTGDFTVQISGLTSNVTYYVRAYATNCNGTSYGSQKSFTTSQSTTTPTVTTNSVSNITQTTATCGGNVTSDGGATVTARGVCWSTSQNPTTSSSHTTDGSGTGSFTSSITGLTSNTTYYVRAYATNSKGTSYGEQKSFTTQSGGGSIGGHEYVDLGLPSGLLWATCNIGADSPHDYGDCFAWGETETKTYFDWDNYKWGSGNHFTKYNQYDGLTTLEPADDAAHVIWGASWRMPTSSEFYELINQCTWIWTTQNGINGCLVTGPSKNSIFLPADGISDDYYSSSLGYPSINACYLHLGGGGVKVNDSYRCFGCFIRPVRQP